MIRWLNALGVILAFAGGLATLTVGQHDNERVDRRAARVQGEQLRFETLADGRRALVDGSGRAIPLADYQRIASGSTIADALLLEFASPERIAAFTQYSQGNELYGHRFAGKPRIDALAEMEQLLELQPDLLIVSVLSSESRLQRLRDAGLNVFVLGEMRGVDSFLTSVRMVATLVGRPDLGEMYAFSFARRLDSIASDLPQAKRKTGAQLTYYGNKIYGSGSGTSYHDVLSAAGLRDVGAEHYDGWPALSIDQVLQLDPDVIVTRDHMGQTLCSNDTLAELRACAHGQRGIVELPDALINDPGPMMLLSAELVHRAVYGEQANSTR